MATGRAAAQNGRTQRKHDLAKPRTTDTIDWVGYWWDEQDLGDTERFQAMGSILRLHQLMTNAMSDALKPFDLTPNSYLLLATIQLSDTGARLLSHLASRIMVHPTTVTLLADRLEDQGLLAREPHPTDRRATRITPAGKALMNEATRALAEADFGLPNLTSAQCHDLVAMLKPVRGALGDDDRAG